MEKKLLYYIGLLLKLKTPEKVCDEIMKYNFRKKINEYMIDQQLYEGDKKIVKYMLRDYSSEKMKSWIYENITDDEIQILFGIDIYSQLYDLANKKLKITSLDNLLLSIEKQKITDKYEKLMILRKLNLSDLYKIINYYGISKNEYLYMLKMLIPFIDADNFEIELKVILTRMQQRDLLNSLSEKYLSGNELVNHAPPWFLQRFAQKFLDPKYKYNERFNAKHFDWLNTFKFKYLGNFLLDITFTNFRKAMLSREILAEETNLERSYYKNIKKFETITNFTRQEMDNYMLEYSFISDIVSAYRQMYEDYLSLNISMEAFAVRVRNNLKRKQYEQKENIRSQSFYSSINPLHDNPEINNLLIPFNNQLKLIPKDKKLYYKLLLIISPDKCLNDYSAKTLAEFKLLYPNLARVIEDCMKYYTQKKNTLLCNEMTKLVNSYFGK